MYFYSDWKRVNDINMKKISRNREQVALFSFKSMDKTIEDLKESNNYKYEFINRYNSKPIKKQISSHIKLVKSSVKKVLESSITDSISTRHLCTLSTKSNIYEVDFNNSKSFKTNELDFLAIPTNINSTPDIKIFDKRKKNSSCDVNTIYRKVFDKKYETLIKPKVKKRVVKDTEGNIVKENESKYTTLDSNSNNIDSQILKIKKKVLFIKGVYDYAYPKIMMEKLKLRVKEDKKNKPHLNIDNNNNDNNTTILNKTNIFHKIRERTPSQITAGLKDIKYNNMPSVKTKQSSKFNCTSININISTNKNKNIKEDLNLTRITNPFRIESFSDQ